MFDDLWRPKGSAAQYCAFNGDAVLSLDVGRRRRWLPEGERVEPLDRHCCWAATAMLLAHYPQPRRHQRRCMAPSAGGCCAGDGS